MTHNLLPVDFSAEESAGKAIAALRAATGMGGAPREPLGFRRP
jgi:hypothetical protein